MVTKRQNNGVAQSQLITVPFERKTHGAGREVK
jgi:hypothetical protein